MNQKKGSVNLKVLGTYPIRKGQKKVKRENRLRDLRDNIKETNTHNIGVPEGERGRKLILRNND